jgi:hypothetical protein
MGYVTGVGVGMAYGLVRPYIRDVPLVLAGIGVGTTLIVCNL